MKFKDMLRKLRKQNKITQEELAEQLNYGASAISNYESGKNEPSISDLIKIADYFGVSIGYLLGTEEFNTRLLDQEVISNLTKQISIVMKSVEKLNELIKPFIE